MRAPFKAGRWKLELEPLGALWALWCPMGSGYDVRTVTDADLAHIERLCKKARKYRHVSKTKRGVG